VSEQDTRFFETSHPDSERVGIPFFRKDAKLSCERAKVPKSHGILGVGKGGLPPLVPCSRDYKRSGGQATLLLECQDSCWPAIRDD
jgi:hypothetical protein